MKPFHTGSTKSHVHRNTNKEPVAGVDNTLAASSSCEESPNSTTGPQQQEPFIDFCRQIGQLIGRRLADSELKATEMTTPLKRAGVKP